MLSFFTMRRAASKKTTQPASPTTSRTERDSAKPKTVTIRPLKRGEFTAQEFDGMALAHGARALTAAEKRTLPGIAAKSMR
jgi:hypothetical protein